MRTPEPRAQSMISGSFPNERRALALITVSVDNAPTHERLWIEDIYQNIFCGTSQGARKQADGIVAVWRKVFAPQSAPPDHQMGLGLRDLQPSRKCEDGEVLDIRRAGEQSAAVTAPPAQPTPPAVMQGGTATFGLRDVGAKKR